MAQPTTATVVYGVFNETNDRESRVALTPELVTRLARSGVVFLL